MADALGTQKRKLEARLSPEQRHCALLLVEKELGEGIASVKIKTEEDIAREIGKTRKTIYMWKTQNPIFIKYMNLIADEYLSAKQAKVYRKLNEIIEKNGSVKAIELYMKRHGLLTDRQEVVTQSVSDEQSDDAIEQSVKELDKVIADYEEKERQKYEQYPRHMGRGFYDLSNGERVQGRENAYSRQAEIDAESEVDEVKE